MVILLPIEPINEAHGALIVKAFNKLFINKGGQIDGYGDGYGCIVLLDGYGTGRGNGVGDGGGRDNVPEEWWVE